MAGASLEDLISDDVRGALNGQFGPLVVEREVPLYTAPVVHPVTGVAIWPGDGGRDGIRPWKVDIAIGRRPTAVLDGAFDFVPLVVVEAKWQYQTDGMLCAAAKWERIRALYPYSQGLYLQYHSGTDPWPATLKARQLLRGFDAFLTVRVDTATNTADRADVPTLIDLLRRMIASAETATSLTLNGDDRSVGWARTIQFVPLLTHDPAAPAV